MLLGFILSSVVVFAQTSPALGNVGQVSANLSMKDETVQIGNPMLVALMITNTGTSVWNLRDSFDCLPHVEGADGEPEKTIYFRQRRHEPGLPELQPGPGGIQEILIPPGEAHVTKFALSKYYVLTVPGDYSVYLEVKDTFGKEIHSNTIHFTVVAASQK